MNPKTSYRPDIDGLRAIAVLSVVLFHLEATGFSGGFIGVDVFFVISGFLITRLIVSEINETGSFSFVGFYVRRIRRLFPAFLFVLSVTIITAAIIFSPTDLINLGASVVHSIFSVSNIYFWKEAGYFDESIKLNPILHTWSLSVEEQFYLFWPAIILFVTARWGMSGVIKVLIATIALSLLLNFVFDQRFILYFWPNTASQNLEDVRAAMFYLGPFRNFELGIGALLVFLINRRMKNELLNEFVFIVGLVLIIIPIFIYNEDIIFPSYNALVPCLGTAMIIYAGNPKFVGRILNNKLAIGIGLISYSLYLVHWPIISIYKYLNLKNLNTNEQIIIGIASIIISLFVYKFIEQPFRRSSKNTEQAIPSFKPIKSLVVVSLVMVLVTASMWVSNGWLWRIDGESKKILSKINNLGQFHLNYYGGSNCKPHLLCSVNSDKESNIYFIGDSHSQAYSYGLAKLFPDYKFTHLDNRCEYSTFDYCYKGKYHESNFVERKAKDFELLKSTNDKIIIAQNWGFKPSHFNTKTKEIVTFDTLESYAKFLAHELDEVSNVLGKNRVIVIGQVHRFGRVSNPLACLGMPIKIHNCATSKGGFAFRFNHLFAQELELLGIQFLSPSQAMCKNKGQCYNINADGMPLFSDWHHLSTWGSEHVVRYFKEDLSEFFERP